MLAEVLERDGSGQSATETRRSSLSNADHLGILNAIWTAETRDAQDRRYRDLITGALPPGYRQELSPKPDGCSGPCVPPSWLASTPRKSPAWRSNPAT